MDDATKTQGSAVSKAGQRPGDVCYFDRDFGYRSKAAARVFADNNLEARSGFDVLVDYVGTSRDGSALIVLTSLAPDPVADADLVRIERKDLLKDCASSIALAASIVGIAVAIPRSQIMEAHPVLGVWDLLGFAFIVATIVFAITTVGSLFARFASRSERRKDRDERVCENDQVVPVALYDDRVEFMRSRARPGVERLNPAHEIRRAGRDVIVQTRDGDPVLTFLDPVVLDMNGRQLHVDLVDELKRRISRL